MTLTRADSPSQDLRRAALVVYSVELAQSPTEPEALPVLEISNETPYDLRFRVLGIPVRVHPMFWAVTACLGWHGEYIGLTLVWVACVFVSILVHEFGHGLMTRHFGGYPSIILQTMGGLCSSDGRWQSSRERMAIIAAGPAAGLLLFLIILTGCDLWIGLKMADAVELMGFGRGHEEAWLKVSSIQSPYLRNAVFDLIYINLLWSLINLLPIFPLDGGQLMGVVLSQTRLRDATRLTHVIGMIVSGVIAAYFLQQGGLSFRAIWFAYFAIFNFQILHALQSHGFDRWN